MCVAPVLGRNSERNASSDVSVCLLQYIIIYQHMPSQILIQVKIVVLRGQRW